MLGLLMAAPFLVQPDDAANFPLPAPTADSPAAQLVESPATGSAAISLQTPLAPLNGHWTISVSNWTTGAAIASVTTASGDTAEFRLRPGAYRIDTTATSASTTARHTAPSPLIVREDASPATYTLGAANAAGGIPLITAPSPGRIP